MFSIKRNQVIITALVVMICVAGYLNYVDSRSGEPVSADGFDLTAGGDVSAVVLDSVTGQEVAVLIPNGEVAIESDYPESTGETGQEPDADTGAAVFVSASADSSFFVQAKLNREQDRSKQKDTLSNLLGSTEIDKDTKSLCAEAILEMTKRMESESETEAALVAKGFGESYVRIDDNWVEVIINKALINDQELAQIEDIVTRLTGAGVEQIRLSSLKSN